MAWYQEPQLSSWQDAANCIGMDPELFFPEAWQAQRAYAITRPLCNMCVVRDECREYALTTGQKEGMWGGMTAQELREERKRRARGGR